MATQTQTFTERKVLRYRVGPRINHAVLAVSFIVLLLTGLVLLWAPLGSFAANGGSRLLHRVGAVLFMAVPVLYLILDRPAAKELLWDSFHYDKDDVAWFKHFFRYFFGHTTNMPPQGRLNAGQKLHHAAVVLVSAIIVASGLVLWFAKGSLDADGLAIAAMTHDAAMLILTVLLVGHLYFTYVYQALPGMTTGYVPEEEARLEHGKWVDELPAEAPFILDVPTKSSK
jgi:formate dehydrogenase subunit gamma